MKIKIKNAKQCRYRLNVLSPGGLVLLDDFQCILPVDHAGPHCGPKGQRWHNEAAFDREMDQRFTVAKPERKIILP